MDLRGVQSYKRRCRSGVPAARALPCLYMECGHDVARAESLVHKATRWSMDEPSDEPSDSRLMSRLSCTRLEFDMAAPASSQIICRRVDTRVVFCREPALARETLPSVRLQ